MKLWKARTARSTHNSPLISRHTALPASIFFGSSAVGGGASSAGASGTVSVNRSRLQLAGGQDDEGLGPGMIVGHGQVYIDGVAFWRKVVKPRFRSTGEL